MRAPFSCVGIAVIVRQTIERADRTAPTAIEHVRVDHRRSYVRMSEQLLHGADVVARLQLAVLDYGLPDAEITNERRVYYQSKAKQFSVAEDVTGA